MADCIDAVEPAFAAYGAGKVIAPGVLGTHVEGGGCHVKAAGLLDAMHGESIYAAKINANFPANPAERGLPTIQGVLALFNAVNGRLLALMDSIEITSLRTAAATAVAARRLAPKNARVTIIGCGEQSTYQLRALACVRGIEHVSVYDVVTDRAARFGTQMHRELGVDVRVLEHFADDAADTNVWITCTPSHRWFLGREHVAPGSFVAAVGADNPEKQEIEPELLAANAVVTDVLEQCATIGDTHHALAADIMTRDDVRAELSDVVAGKRGRESDEEILIFDSTGTALQDVAAAAIVYERALKANEGFAIDLSSA
jgi:ornithine cyclodeaminase/alanine dehydrogenase-like protein (mu-crystallin family)